MAGHEELLGHSTRASCVEPRLTTEVCTNLSFALDSIFFPIIFSHQDTLLHIALLISTCFFSAPLMVQTLPTAIVMTAHPTKAPCAALLVFLPTL